MKKAIKMVMSLTMAFALAAGLFGALREIDRAGIELAYGEALSRAGLGEAVMNRFLKAAGGELRREEEKA